MARVEEAARDLCGDLVRDARAQQRLTWSQVGDAFGMTTQSARWRFSRTSSATATRLRRLPITGASLRMGGSVVRACETRYLGALLVAPSATGISVTILKGVLEVEGAGLQETNAELVEVVLVDCAVRRNGCSSRVSSFRLVLWRLGRRGWGSRRSQTRRCARERTTLGVRTRVPTDHRHPREERDEPAPEAPSILRCESISRPLRTPGRE